MQYVITSYKGSPAPIAIDTAATRRQAMRLARKRAQMLGRRPKWNRALQGYVCRGGKGAYAGTHCVCVELTGI